MDHLIVEEPGIKSFTAQTGAATARESTILKHYKPGIVISWSFPAECLFLG
jgi:hypothetical protein